MPEDNWNNESHKKSAFQRLWQHCRWSCGSWDYAEFSWKALLENYSKFLFKNFVKAIYFLKKVQLLPKVLSHHLLLFRLKPKIINHFAVTGFARVLFCLYFSRCRAPSSTRVTPWSWQNTPLRTTIEFVVSCQLEKCSQRLIILCVSARSKGKSVGSKFKFYQIW